MYLGLNDIVTEKLPINLEMNQDALNLNLTDLCLEICALVI